MSYRNDEGLNGPSPWPGFRDATPRGSDTGLGQSIRGEIITPSNIPRSVGLTNITRPGASDYLVGDDWMIRVTGPASQTVSVTARQNTGPWSTSSYGQTDGNGEFVLRGRMGAEHVGRWEETWTVGGQMAGTIVFDVKFQPAQTQPGKTPLPPPATDTGVKITPPPPAATDWMATLKAPSLFGLPLWMLIVGVGAGIYFLKRSG